MPRTTDATKAMTPRDHASGPSITFCTSFTSDIRISAAQPARTPTLDHIFLGVRAGCAALILMSLVKLVQKVMDGPLAWSLGVIAFVASVVLGIDITYIILFGFLVGCGHIAICRRKGRSK